MKKIGWPRRLITKRWSKSAQLRPRNCKDHLLITFFNRSPDLSCPTSDHFESLRPQPWLDGIPSRNINEDWRIRAWLVSLQQSADDSYGNFRRLRYQWTNVWSQSSMPGHSIS